MSKIPSVYSILVTYLDDSGPYASETSQVAFEHLKDAKVWVMNRSGDTISITNCGWCVVKKGENGKSIEYRIRELGVF